MSMAVLSVDMQKKEKIMHRTGVTGTESHFSLRPYPALSLVLRLMGAV